MTDSERYQVATRRMQTGVAYKMGRCDGRETEPKHLRVGVNAAMSDHGGLVKLLIAKGVFTEEEYVAAIADQMEIEAASYEQAVQEFIPGLRFG